MLPFIIAREILASYMDPEKRVKTSQLSVILLIIGSLTLPIRRAFFQHSP